MQEDVDRERPVVYAREDNDDEAEASLKGLEAEVGRLVSRVQDLEVQYGHEP